MRSEIKIGLLVALGVVVVGAFVWNASRSGKNGGSVQTLPWDNSNRNSNTNSAAVHRPPAAQTPRTPANAVHPTSTTPPRPTGSPTNTTPPPPTTVGQPGGNTSIPPSGNPAAPPRTSPTLPPLGLLPDSSSGAGTPDRSHAEPNTPTSVPPSPTPGGGPAPGPGGASVPTSMPSPRSSAPPTGEARPGPSVAVPPAGPLPPTTGTLPRARPDSLTPPSAGAAKHKIAEGDTIWAIAEKYLGSGSRWPEIKAANPGLDEGRLLVGKEITIPAGTAAPANANPTSPPTARSNERPAPRGGSAAPTPSGTTSGREARPAPRDTTAAPRNSTRPARTRAYTYKVEEGDSLVSIARNILKDGDRWREIYELNKAKIGKRPDVLFVGLELKLPE